MTNREFYVLLAMILGAFEFVCGYGYGFGHAVSNVITVVIAFLLGKYSETKKG